MRLTLIRHTSVDVAPGTCYGQTDVPVRSTFAEEAELTRQTLCGKTFDKVYMSPLSRCVKLAAYCGYGDAERDARLMELNFGEWEMRKFNEITPAPTTLVRRLSERGGHGRRVLRPTICPCG